MGESEVTIWNSQVDNKEILVGALFDYVSAPSIDASPTIGVVYQPIKPPPKDKPEKPIEVKVVISNSFVADANAPKRMQVIQFSFPHSGRFSGKYVIDVKWVAAESGAEHSSSLLYQAGYKLNQPEKLFVTTVAPRLCKLLQEPLSTAEEYKVLDASAIEHKVGHVLSAVFRNLTRGLGYLWKQAGPECCNKDGAPFRNVDLGSLNSPEEVEECWAQHFTELVLGAPYNGAGSTMGAPVGKVKDSKGQELSGIDEGHRKDAWVFQQYTRDTTPVYPQMFACQQLSTMGVLSRGHYSLSDNPLDSHGAHVGTLPESTIWQKTVAPKLGQDNWLKGKNISAAQAFERNLIVPGTCFYYFRESTNFPHVAVLLRGFRTSKQVQLLDTGGWIGNDSAFQGDNGSLAFDTKPVSELIPTNAEVTGIVAPPKSQDLKEAIRRMREAQPIGALQLLISSKSRLATANIVWASNLLPMSHGSHRFPISRLLASMRGVPFCGELTVFWRVYAPNSTAATEKATLTPNAWWSARGGDVKAVIELTEKDGIPQIVAKARQGHALTFSPLTWPALPGSTLTPVVADRDAAEYFGLSSSTPP